MIHATRFEINAFFTPIPDIRSVEALNQPEEHMKITLTKEQKEAVKAATGKDAETIELSAEELEERIAPRQVGLG
jgi:hypothetical protein